ncbi:ammonium transporter [bacterium]|nr:ammonium transporter [bacterium]
MRKPGPARPLILAALVLLAGSLAQAQDVGATSTISPEITSQFEDVNLSLAFVWMLLAATLVFFMQAGFALVEAGFTRAKNACNILMKNIMDFSMGSIAYFAVGFGLMFGASTAGGWVGSSLFALKFPEGVDADWGVAFWFFQVVFAGTACTIVSGAMAERTKFVGYLCYSFLISLFIYPIFGKWAWGSLLLGDAGAGWLEGLGFTDFAGSTVVHSVGGWAALAGAIVLGPRIGKFIKGKPQAILGHSMPLAAAGTFILWFGWYGFNAGSTTSGADRTIGWICATTTLAAGAGAIAAMITGWIKFKKPDTGMTLNGALAGLVGITAGCANVSPLAAIAIGAVAGVIVVVSVLTIEKVFKIDDPVGAISVHGVCGAWGTLAVGVFDPGVSLGVQAIGVGAAFLWTFPLAFTIFFALRKLGLLRVSEEEELIGLDIVEHGNEAYPAPAWGTGAPAFVPTTSTAPAPSPAAQPATGSLALES